MDAMQNTVTSTSPAIIMENVVKTYGSGPTAVHAVKGVNLKVWPGEVVGLLGPSGSGKTTLLQCLGAVIDPTAGRIILGGETIYDDGWKINDLRALRRDKIGFVFQASYLMPFISVLDNVALLPMLAGKSNREARERAMELLTALEVNHRSHAKPAELSGGEQQRVAIARALANKPPFILADEPTAPLDSDRSLIVMKMLTKIAEQYQTAIILITHDDIIIPRMKRLYRLRDGVAHEEEGKGQPFLD
ncbi:MAG: ABC transporter ATP-binding protein [Negativicutes bacterium]|nr:ABC transporter ATP-binding protein [Negativicutes bacterium]